MTNYRDPGRAAMERVAYLEAENRQLRVTTDNPAGLSPEELDAQALLFVVPIAGCAWLFP